ncbi:MAG: hypothetical protein ACLTS6_17275 [Anaerobutyricum sp.]
MKGYVFDSKNPGSGETFDWKLLAHIRQKQKTDLFLAGGIDETNVKRAISEVGPGCDRCKFRVEKVARRWSFLWKDPKNKNNNNNSTWSIKDKTEILTGKRWRDKRLMPQ